MKNNIEKYSLIGLCLLLFCLLIVKGCQTYQAEQAFENTRTVDTVFVPKPFKVIEIQKQYIETPVQVIVYLKDTVLRTQAEHSDIITGIDFKRHNLFHKLDFITIDKINPLGIVFSSKYQVDPVREIKIDGSGNLQTKKKRHIGLKIASGIVATSVTAFIVRQELRR